jgi:photosystem II stability/assembly factor-like uncharacterized protein
VVTGVSLARRDERWLRHAWKKDVAMEMHLMRALGTAGSAGALTLLCLTGAGGAAAAAPSPAQAAPARPVASLSVPGNFVPGAASFASPAWGVVLGGSGCTFGHLCPAQLAVTTDGGARWSLMPAPAVWLANPQFNAPEQVSRVLFANPADGWLYNQYSSSHIWATRNGGASWREITLPGDIETMAASARTVYALAGNELYHSPVGQNTWTRVNPQTRYGPMTGSTLAVLGNSVWLGTNTYLWTTADGVHWARYALHSPGTAYGVPYGLSGIAAATARDVAFLWGSAQGMYHTVTQVQISFNGGQAERQAPSAPPPEGNTYGFAAAPGRFGVLLIAAVSPGPDLIYRSANLGQTWTSFKIPGTGGGIGLNSLQFMSPAAACYVVGDPGVGEPGNLMCTANAGQTWHLVRF